MRTTSQFAHIAVRFVAAPETGASCVQVPAPPRTLGRAEAGLGSGGFWDRAEDGLGSGAFCTDFGGLTVSETG